MAADNAKRPRKSRAGCRNCKIRKVKCDEARPRCKKCESYGVVCNYQRTVPDLQLSSEQGSRWGVFSVRESPRKTASQQNGRAAMTQPRTSARRSSPTLSAGASGYNPPISPPLSTPLVSADDISSVELDALSVEFLNHFRFKTAPTLGGPRMQKIFDEQIMQLAFQTPVLMHAALAIAASHDRYLRNPSLTKRSLREIYHWSRCTALFSRKLSAPILPQDRDAFWATATYLGIVCFAAVDASNPHEAWPLKPLDDPSDLEWVRMSAGKAVIWELTDPLRPESIFYPMAPVYAQLHAALPRSGIDNIPPVLRQLCGIDGNSTADNNPYFIAVQGLHRLASVPRPGVSLFFALTFISHIDASYRVLLSQKDPAALLLLALWYAGASRSVWWIERRAEVEGRAICLYLERYHWDNSLIMEILPWKSVGFEATDLKVLDTWTHEMYGAML